MASIFTRIVNGEIPCYKVAESDEYFAFLDINPVAFGHCLVIPKKEVDYIFDLDSKTYQGLFAYAKTVAAALEQAVNCQRIGITVLGLEVPHAHVHLVPLDKRGVIDFSTKFEFSKEEMIALAEKVATFLKD